MIGKTTAAALQSGLVYGFAGQVDGIVERIRGELGGRGARRRHRRPRRADRAARPDDHRASIPCLTLEGLRLVWELNAGD